MAEDKKPSRFNGKRVSRKIVPITISVIIGLALIVFLSKYGVNPKPVGQVEKEKAAATKKEDSLMNSTRISAADIKDELNERETRVIKQNEKTANDKVEADKKAKALAEALNAGHDDYPKESLPGDKNTDSKIDEYEKRKLAVTQPRPHSSSASSGMGVYESYRGSTLKSVSGIADDLSIPAVGDLASGLGGVIDPGQASMDKALEKTIAEGDAPPADKDPNSSFKDTVTKSSKSEANETLKPKYPQSKFMVMAGGFIPTVLMSSINTLLPNIIQARVTENVYDSIHGEYLLIPAGSVIKGTYNSSVVEGQDRVFIAFDRLIYPSGASLDISGMTGGDQQGIGGAKGNVSSEFWASLGSSFLIAAVGSVADSQSKNTVNNYGGSSGGISSAAGQILAEAARASAAKFAKYKTKITVEAGQKLTIMVAKDMELDPYKTFKGPK